MGQGPWQRPLRRRGASGPGTPTEAWGGRGHGHCFSRGKKSDPPKVGNQLLKFPATVRPRKIALSLSWVVASQRPLSPDSHRLCWARGLSPRASAPHTRPRAGTEQVGKWGMDRQMDDGWTGRQTPGEVSPRRGAWRLCYLDWPDQRGRLCGRAYRHACSNERLEGFSLTWQRGNGSNLPMKSTERNKDPNKTNPNNGRDGRVENVPKCKHSGGDAEVGGAAGCPDWRAEGEFPLGAKLQRTLALSAGGCPVPYWAVPITAPQSCVCTAHGRPGLAGQS